MSGLVQLRRGPGSPTPAPAPDAPGVYVETFGCQMNEADSALMLGQLARRGYRPVREPAEADVILINTCAVRERAEERVFGRTTQLLAHRRQRPDLVIGITGCMAEHLREKIAARAPHVTLVAGPDTYRRIGALVDEARAGARVLDVALDREETYEGLDALDGPGPVGHAQGPQALSGGDGVSGQVTIQRGCDKFCTFCVVPFTRGRERGVPPREVLRQVRRLAERGFREVQLLGQTVNSYRHEGADFADLLAAVCEVEGIERVRFTSPYPVDFSDRVIEAMARLPKVCPQIHLPVQSGSDRVLRAMGRGYTRGEFLDLVDRLRARIPGICLSTDVMVGFCGERDEDHRATVDLMERVRFETAFLFRYSDRDITYASKKLHDDVPDAVKASRLSEVIAVQDRHTREHLAARVGGEVEVLVQGISRRGDRTLGRCRHFFNVLLPLGAAEPGELVHARVTGTTGRALLAEPITA